MIREYRVFVDDNIDREEKNSTKRYCDKPNYFDIANEIIIGMLKMAEKHFSMFALLSSVAFTTVLFILKVYGFIYYRGRMSIYNIASDYINIGYGFYSQIVLYAGATIIIIISNIIGISCSYGKNKLYRSYLLYVLFESAVIFLIILLISNPRAVIIEVITDSIYGKLAWIFVEIYIMVGAANAFFLSYVILGNPEKKIHREDACTEILSFIRHKVSHIIVCLICTSLIYSLILFQFGKSEELSRKRYKVLIENREIPSGTGGNTKHSADGTGSEYKWYAVVYENNDIYIICPLVLENGITMVDETTTKIIDNRNIETYSFNDVTNINIAPDELMQ